jgi:hypothetical protein
MRHLIQHYIEAAFAHAGPIQGRSEVQREVGIGEFLHRSGTPEQHARMPGATGKRTLTEAQTGRATVNRCALFDRLSSLVWAPEFKTGPGRFRRPSKTYDGREVQGTEPPEQEQV